MRGLLTAAFSLAVLAGPLMAQPLTLYTEIAPPGQYLDAEGRLTGIGIEVVREIQRRIDSTEPIQVVPWVRGYNELQTRSRIILFSTARTPERAPLFDWVGPIYENTYSFFVNARSKVVIRNLSDARRLKLIGVYKEDARDQYLTQAGFTNLDRSLDATIMVKKLMDRRIDAMAASPSGIRELMTSAGFRPSDVREAYPFARVPLYLAFSKGTAQFTLQAWSTALQDMKRDGTYQRILLRFETRSPRSGPAAPPTPP